MINHQIHIYYGYGKGKTTACTGLAIRALGAGKKVCIIYFDKGHKKDNEHYSERNILKTVKHCELIPTGCERLLANNKFRFSNTEEDIKEAQRALSIAKQKINTSDIDMLILDEVLAAVRCQLITEEDVMSIIRLYKEKRPFELILSGHEIWDDLLKEVDLVTEMKKVKHYYDQGLLARVGIEI